MSKTLRLAALTLAAGSAVALFPAATATAVTTANNGNGTMFACLTRSVGGTGGITLTADGPNFKTVGPLGPYTVNAPICAFWNMKPGQYVVAADNQSSCTLLSSTVTREGKTKTLTSATAARNSSPELFGLTNVATGKVTRVDWVFSTC